MSRFIKRIWPELKNSGKQFLEMFVEWIPMLLLALYITGPYLDLRENYFITGYEYVLTTISHYIWNYVPLCGSCVLWNGYLNGGMPAFAELHGAVLHPLVIFTTLIWGVSNGSKIVAVVSIIFSGLATWWLAKELDTGRLARIWISLFGVAGGHIIGRLEAGNVILVLSTVSAALVLPMVLRLNKGITPRRIAWLAILLASLWLSGQGYIQLGVLIAWFPAFIYLFYQPGQKKQEKWMAFVQAFLLSLALAAILLVPAARFVGVMDKYTMDDLKSLQPFAYIPLNLVISDIALYGQTYLGMDTFPYEHINFIGWIPVIFAVIAGYFVLKQERKRVYAALYLSIFLVLIFTSREVMLALMQYIPLINQLRSFSVATSLMVPPVLGMAAWGLQQILQADWPLVAWQRPQEALQRTAFSFKWLVLIPLLLLSLKDITLFSQLYITLRNVEIPQEDLSFIQLDDTQWVTPSGIDWFPILMSKPQKLIMTDRPWNWKSRERLSGYIALVFNPDNNEIEGELLSRGKNFDVMRHPEFLYAFVSIPQGETSQIVKCNASSLGGIIDVTCDSPAAGVLTVHDYLWSGWYAWMDGQPINLLDSDWLTVQAAPGRHVYSFRYTPWDVYVGGALTLLGLGLALWMILKKQDVNSTFISA